MIDKHLPNDIEYNLLRSDEHIDLVPEIYTGFQLQTFKVQP